MLPLNIVNMECNANPPSRTVPPEPRPERSDGQLEQTDENELGGKESPAVSRQRMASEKRRGRELRHGWPFSPPLPFSVPPPELRKQYFSRLVPFHEHPSAQNEGCALH